MAEHSLRASSTPLGSGGRLGGVSEGSAVEAPSSASSRASTPPKCCVSFSCVREGVKLLSRVVILPQRLLIP